MLNETDENEENEPEEVLETAIEVTRCGGLCIGQTRMNLLVMLWIWMTSTTCFELLNLYTRFLSGDVYINFAMAGAAEVLGQAFAAILFMRIDPRKTFFISFLLAFIGGVGLMAADAFYPAKWLYIVGVFLAMFGVAMALCGSYVATPFLFPTLICGTAFGICNIFGRFMVIVSPTLSELHDPIPMSVFSFFCLIAMLLSLLLK